MYEWLVLSEEHLPVPKKKYRKAILKTGNFVKEIDGEKELEFKLTEENLKAMAAVSTQYMKDGHKIPIPLGHTDDEDKNRGYVDAIVFDEKDQLLYMTAEAIGAKAIEQFEQSDCSCYIPPKWNDSEGREYIRPIRHVALTQYPVISGLGKFEAIAASLVPTRKETPMKFDKIQAALSLSEPLTEENAEALILGGIGQLVEKAKNAEPADPLKAAREAVKALPGAITGAKMGREAKLNALVLGNKISPAVKTKLAEMYTGEDSLVLSLTAKEGETEFDKLVAILSENKVVNTGEKTGHQVQDDASKGNENPLLLSAKKMADEAKALAG